MEGITRKLGKVQTEERKKIEIPQYLQFFYFNDITVMKKVKGRDNRMQFYGVKFYLKIETKIYGIKTRLLRIMVI